MSMFSDIFHPAYQNVIIHIYVVDVRIKNVQGKWQKKSLMVQCHMNL